MEADEPLEFATAREFDRWLEQNHATAKEVWVVHYKKGCQQKALSYLNAVEETLRFGWIDSKLKKIDEDRFALRYSPRKPNSVWSQSNKAKALKLIKEGKMTAFGLAVIEEAKKNGRWESAKPASYKH